MTCRGAAVAGTLPVRSLRRLVQRAAATQVWGTVLRTADMRGFGPRIRDWRSVHSACSGASRNPRAPPGHRGSHSRRRPGVEVVRPRGWLRALHLDPGARRLLHGQNCRTAGPAHDHDGLKRLDRPFHTRRTCATPGSSPSSPGASSCPRSGCPTRPSAPSESGPACRAAVRQSGRVRAELAERRQRDYAALVSGEDAGVAEVRREHELVVGVALDLARPQGQHRLGPGRAPGSGSSRRGSTRSLARAARGRSRRHRGPWPRARGRGCEGLDPVRFEAGLPPDAPDGHRAHPDLARESTGAPVGGPRGRLGQVWAISWSRGAVVGASHRGEAERRAGQEQRDAVARQAITGTPHGSGPVS